MSDSAKTQTQKWIERYEAVSWPTFGRRRIALSHGRGTRVWDVEGKAYLDFLTGIAVTNLGHSHPAIVEAIKEQADKLLHCTNLYYIPAQIEWAEMLSFHSFGGKVFFSNCGAEANEAMIKLARKYAADNFAPERRTIITCVGSFHGRTLATLTATGQDKGKEGFAPLMPGFRHATYNDVQSIRAAVTDDVMAVMVEPVIGEGGVLPATQEFMDTLKELREEKGILLLFDEVQTGLGRTGKNFAYQHFGVEPDIMTLAKPVAGGLPAGAIIAREEVAEAMTPGSHGGTMIGNPMVSASGRAYCKVLFEEGLADQAAAMGAKTMETLKTWIDEVPCVEEVRGLGLMIGIRLNQPGGDVVLDCENNGLLINCTAGNVIRLLPPLNVSQEEMDEALGTLRQAIEKLN